MSSLTIRVRTSSGMKRFSVLSSASLRSFLQLLASSLGPGSVSMVSSTGPVLQASNTTLEELGWKDGEMVFLNESKESAGIVVSASEETKTVFKLTARCQHGPKDRCIHCAYGELGMTTKFICNHPPSAKCVNCSSFVASGKGSCTHPATAFCPNCVPEESMASNGVNARQEQLKKMFCHCKGGQKCIYCSLETSAVKVDIEPWQKYVQELRAMCRFKHGPKTQCASCAVEDLPNFKINLKCTNGHHPWPKGSCSKCMPPNAVLKVQHYRHCDYVSFQDERVGNKFVSEWLLNPFIQRAALLFGYFVDEPEETKNPGAIRAQVQAMYYPPQESKDEGLRFLSDNKETNVLAIAEKLGMRPVGWCITVINRPFDEKKYGGEMILSAAEVRQAAVFQNKFKNPDGRSPFVTVLFKCIRFRFVFLK